MTDDRVGVLDPDLSDEEVRSRLRSEQREAGARIGVTSQHWLDYPDAGEYSYFELRTHIIRRIREVRPDFVMSVDPYLPYESHRDHLVVGRASAESLLMYRFPRIETDAQVDAAYAAGQDHEISGIAFYFTRSPNTVFDIGASREVKHEALRAYRSQFTPEGLEALSGALEAAERMWAADEPFEHGEALKVLKRDHLHVNLDPRI